MPDPPIKPPNKGAEKLLNEIEIATKNRTFDEKLGITIAILVNKIAILEDKINALSEK